MNYISEYDDMKFEAEFLKTAGFATASPFGLFVMQLFFHDINLSLGFIMEATKALLSLSLFWTLIDLSHAKMKARERLLKLMHKRRTL